MNLAKKYAGLLFLLLSIPALFISGCSSTPDNTTSGFLDNYSELEKGVYFKSEYIDSEASFSDITAVKVAPVNLSHLDDKTSCDTNELEKLAGEFRANVEKELQAAGFTITSTPGENVAIVRLALTNIEPPKVLQNVAVTAASVFSPVPLPFDNDGTTAFEGQITKGASDKAIIEFAEMDSGAGGFSVKSKLVGNYTKFTNTEILFKNWSHNIARMLKDLKEGTKAGPPSKAKKVFNAATSLV